MKHLVVFLLLLASPLAAQGIAWGVRTGVPLTDAFKHGLTSPINPRTYTSDTRRYTFGPTVELMLPLGVSIQLDALYKRVGFESQQGAINSETRANSWEFPLLLKLRSPGIVFRPFVEGGLSFQTLSGLKQFTAGLIGGGSNETDVPDELRHKHNRGYVAGVGFDIKTPVVRISPEVRYTRWEDENFLATINIFRTNKNQADFLIGFTF